MLHLHCMGFHALYNNYANINALSEVKNSINDNYIYNTNDYGKHKNIINHIVTT